jgi:hypothetical protein
MKIYHAAYLAMLIYFTRMILSKIIPDGVERTLWLNLRGDDISVRIHTSDNSVLLNAIKDKMIEHEWQDEVLSIGNPAFPSTAELDDPTLPSYYYDEYITEIIGILKEFGLR